MTVNALKQQRVLSIALLVTLTCDSSLARRLRFHERIDAHRAAESNDFYMLRHISPKSAKSGSAQSSKSSKNEGSYSSKSSKTSESKSAKSSYSTSKSGKASSYAGHNDADEYVSSGKSGKASYAVAIDSMNDLLPFVGGSNDFGSSSIPNSANSNDVSLHFEADASLNENAGFFPIIFEPLDPEVLMLGTIDPTERPTPTPSSRQTTRPTADPTSNPTSKPTLEPSNDPIAAPLPCGITASERSEQIVEILGVDSSIGPTSPQSLALDWITNKDGLLLCPDNEDALIQRYVAAVFYYSTGGGGWNQCNAPSDLGNAAAVIRANEECRVRATTFPDLTSGSDAWMTASSECEWGGLACFADGSIREISFENNGFVGTIPSELKELTELRRLALQQGALYGTIPSDLSLLTNLLVVDLDYNELSGTLPWGLFSNWTVLKELDLNNNMFEGTISSRIGELTDLRFLQLDSNDLTGTLPTQLGSLDKLIFMSAADLDLNGIVPSQVCANRGEPTNPDNGNLAVLITDCDPADQKVFCECCSDCGVQEQGAIVSQLAPFWIAQERGPAGNL